MDIINTYRDLTETTLKHYTAHELSHNAHNDSRDALAINNPHNHSFAAQSHDMAMNSHKKAAMTAKPGFDRKYHEHMAKHHEFLKGHHDSMV